MGRHAFLETARLTAEGRAQALKHAKDAVDRSAWFLAMVRRDLAEDLRVGTLQRLEVRRSLADIENRQVFLSTAYDEMAAMPIRGESMELKLFFVAYDKFLDAVHTVRMARYARQVSNQASLGSSAPRQ